MELLLGLLTVMFDLAIRVAAPLLCLMFLVMVAMGFISRTVPQMNILSVGFAVRILVGIWLLIAFAAGSGTAFVQAAREVLHRLTMFFTTAT